MLRVQSATVCTTDISKLNGDGHPDASLAQTGQNVFSDKGQGWLDWRLLETTQGADRYYQFSPRLSDLRGGLIGWLGGQRLP